MENLFEYFDSPDWHICKDSGDTPKKNGHYLVVYGEGEERYVALMYFDTNFIHSFLYEPTDVWYRLSHKAWMPYNRKMKSTLKPLEQ